MIFRRILFVFPILLGISLLVFGMLSWIPGDPALAILGPYATPENVASVRQELRLDDPWPTRYLSWMADLARGDLGHSFSLERPVRDEVMERFAATLLLAGCAFLLCALMGIAAGVFMAIRQGSLAERIVAIAVTMGISVPSFWLGLVLILVFAVHLQWLPASGMIPVLGEAGVVAGIRHLILPAVTLALVAASVLARLMRAQMLEVLRLDFIRTARAKGVPERRVLWRHAFRVALPPVIPLLGLQAGYVLGGAVYVETIFQWPGIGRMLVEAILTRDLLLIQGGVLVVATSYVLINLLADIIQQLLDPRTREEVAR